jgi:membrane-associated phospholipid phosphatase
MSQCWSLLEVSVRDDWMLSTTTIVATLLSFLPWLLGLLVFAGSIQNGRLRQLLPLTILVMVANEGVLKRIFSQPRPEMSCLSSKGMPSSHSALSIAWACAVSRWPTHFLWLSALLVAVPWARVHVGDHTVAQVVAGGLVGTTLAVTIDQFRKYGGSYRL